MNASSNHRTQKQAVKRIALVFVLLMIALNTVIKLLRQPIQKEESIEHTISKERLDNLLYHFEDNRFDQTEINHNRCWKEFKSVKEHCIAYQIEHNDAKKSAYERTFELSFPDPNKVPYYKVWGNIYKQMVDHQPQKLLSISDSLKRIAVQQKMNHSEVADLVVSFVQDMPYWFVLDRGDCNDPSFNTHPCIDGVRFGLLSPLETAYTALGDCDTRTVLLFVLFKQLGFKPLILISRQYAHSMLALHMNSSGSFIRYKGERYYFWETTAVGWQSGMLPPENSNKDYWRIALAHDH